MKGLRSGTKRAPKRLIHQLVVMRDLLEILGHDTVFCQCKLDDELRNPGTSNAEINQLNFWLKAAVRTFLAQVEGLTCAMRWSVVRAAEAGHIKLEGKIIAQLQERRFDKATGEIGSAYHGRFDENFKNAFRYFPQIFGSSWSLNLQGADWERFRKIVDARDDFTHPKKTEQLFQWSAGEDLHPAVAWFNNQFNAMLSEIGRRLGKEITFSTSKAEALSEPAKAKLVLVRPPSMTGDLSLLMQELGFMALLKNDDRVAYEIFRYGTSLQSGRLSIGKFSSTGARLYVRTLFTEIEAFGHLAKRLLDDSAAKSEICFSEEEQGLLSTKELTLKIAYIAEVFSRKFGYGRVIDKAGRLWLAFSRLAEFRDRITHPKRPEDLQFDMETLEAMIDAMDWYIQFLDILELSDKYVALPFQGQDLNA